MLWKGRMWGWEWGVRKWRNRGVWEIGWRRRKKRGSGKKGGRR